MAHPEDDDWNTIVEIKKYLSTPDQPPMSNKEFMEFWGELTEEEKDEFRRTDLE